MGGQEVDIFRNNILSGNSFSTSASAAKGNLSIKSWKHIHNYFNEGGELDRAAPGPDLAGDS